ncbi:ABC transporter substrate-binding protein [Novosphingobium sp. M1R2S20]|uniref:ABC transporter substrate-binding protein n=1 Tax=Novosphingobium rhizovicinum TaxID=3228928 RepID=A0ABV3RDE5_9SPHN
MPRSDTRPTLVSLNPCSDATLAEVAAPGQLLAVSHYSLDPAASSMGVAAAERFGAVSGSVEEIAALQPDMVVADIFLPPATRQALEDLGIRVVSIGATDSVETSKAQIRQLAEETGNSEQGEDLISKIEHALASSAPQRGAAPIPAIVWQSGGIVAGDSTLVADLLRRTGFINGAAARGLRQADYLPLEAVLADPPEVVIAAGDAHSQENRLLSHPALRALPDIRYAAFDSTLLWCGGPTIIRAVERLARIRRGLPSSASAARFSGLATP